MPIIPAPKTAKSIDTALNEAASMLVVAWSQTRRATVSPDELAIQWFKMRQALEGVLTDT